MSMRLLSEERERSLSILSCPSRQIFKDVISPPTRWQLISTLDDSSTPTGEHEILIVGYCGPHILTRFVRILRGWSVHLPPTDVSVSSQMNEPEPRWQATLICY